MIAPWKLPGAVYQRGYPGAPTFYEPSKYRVPSREEILDFEETVGIPFKTIEYRLGEKWDPEMQQFVAEAEADVAAFRRQALETPVL